MRIVVIGGTGLIGSKLVKRLQTRGHDVLAASPNSGVNTVTGEGLAEALNEAEVVVDVANSPSFEDAAVMEFFETSGRNLLMAEAEAGVRHHIALSVVGTERLQESGYFRAKLAQEKLIREAKIPYSLVHSTQFFEFMGSIAQSGMQGEESHISSALIQPISSEDVADAMVEVIVGPPVNGTVEIAGPDTGPLSDFVSAYLKQVNDGRKVVVDTHSKYFGVELNDKSLMPAIGARVGKVKFSEWVKTALSPQAH